MHVLLVEDSAFDRRMLRAMVEHLGHTCDEATDGADAWARLSQREYDVIVTDWMMPSISGPELCRQIRNREGSPFVFTVVCTGTHDRERGLEAVRTGADLFLTKPVDVVSLEMCLITGARVVSMHRLLAAQNAQLRNDNVALAADAHTDHLTGLANRRRLDEELRRYAGLATRYDLKACVAMCDVDRFKAYNDRFGHLAGDRVLARLGGILRATGRESDTAFRFGGEELLVLLPGQTPVTAAVAGERLRLAVEGAMIPHPDNQPYGIVTISVGVAGLRGGSWIDPDELLNKADEALYAAKRAGRNRVVVHPSSVNWLGGKVVDGNVA
jgi:two-component system chemotaxis response regulator CheY